VKITNEIGIPTAIVNAVKHQRSKYSGPKGEHTYSVTQLSNPARQETLKARHFDELTEDASDMLYALTGSIGHNILEKAKADGDIVEHRITTKVPIKVLEGREKTVFTLSGQFDLLNAEKTIIDYKFGSVWEFIYGIKDERVKQLNSYAWLYQRETGRRVNKIQIVMIFRDWSKMEAHRRKLQGDTNYPQRQVAIIDIELQSEEEQYAHIVDRIKAHHKSATTHKWLPECTDEERWASETKWAVMKDGNKKASKLCESDAEAKAYIEGHKDAKKMSVVERKGEYKRCEFYCVVNKFCSQYNREDQPDGD
jgi:hypothetical protein